MLVTVFVQLSDDEVIFKLFTTLHRPSVYLIILS